MHEACTKQASKLTMQEKEESLRPFAWYYIPLRCLRMRCEDTRMYATFTPDTRQVSPPNASTYLIIPRREHEYKRKSGPQAYLAQPSPTRETQTHGHRSPWGRLHAFQRLQGNSGHVDRGYALRETTRVLQRHMFSPSWSRARVCNISPHSMSHLNTQNKVNRGAREFACPWATLTLPPTSTHRSSSNAPALPKA